MKITKLEYQKKDPSRVSVYIDGQFAVGVSADDILNLKIYKDKEISQEELTNIIGQSEFGKVFNFAVNFISFRPRSEHELMFRLKRKFGEDAIASLQHDIKNKLHKIGLLDDEAFARWFVEQRNTFRPKSDRIMKHELRSKGITDEIIKKTLENDETSEFEKAFKLIKKPMDREKLIRFLGSRGFSWDTIEDVLAKLKNKD